jgi:hypothetical protein
MTHTVRKEKERYVLPGMQQQGSVVSDNKGWWSATTRRNPGGEALVGLGKATSMRECGAMQIF